MFSQTDNQIEFFFKDPAMAPVRPGDNSTLYLLRRDVNDCIPQNRCLFLGVMGILAGVDLIAKFLAGQDGGGLGSRFKRFLRDYFPPLNPGEDETLYQLRNSLLHSFGLYSRSRSGRDFHFLVTPRGANLLEDAGQDTFLVGVNPLHERFETAVNKFAGDVRTRDDLKNNFGLMFSKYGSIHVS